MSSLIDGGTIMKRYGVMYRGTENAETETVRTEEVEDRHG